MAQNGEGIMLSNRKIIMMLCLCLLLCTVLSGCDRETTQTQAQVQATSVSSEVVTQIAQNMQTTQVSGVEAAKVYDQISTTEKVVSIVFEGHTEDMTTLRGLVDVLDRYDVPAVFFLSATATTDCPDGVTVVRDSGYDIGNYGIATHQERETYSIDDNLYFFEKSQELLTTFLGQTPSLFRSNDSIYTQELLQTATLAGFEAGVLPNTFLNHRSFQDQSSATYYVSHLVRGSVISIKVGQELTASEYEDVSSALDEKPAIDKEPGLENIGTSDSLSWDYEQVIQTTAWLLEALEADGYEVVSLETLQSKDMHFYDEPITLSEEQADVYNALQYYTPQTATPLGVTESVSVSADWFDDALFIGDESTTGFGYYNTWVQSQNTQAIVPRYYATGYRLSVEKSLDLSWIADETLTFYSVDETMPGSDDIGKVYLMLGYYDITSTTSSAYVDNLKILLYELKQAYPNATIYIQSLLPRVLSQTALPSNERIFAYNLALAEFCEQYQIFFVDVAFALKDELGNLPDNLCSDVQMTGRVLSDQAYQLWLDYLLTHTGN